MSNFFTWLDATTAAAQASEVGKAVAAAGNYTVAHTGGGCLCWEQIVPDGYLWICDQGSGLGDKLDEPYLVGLYRLEGDVLADGTLPNLQAALEWCEMYGIARKWAVRIGLGFHPDTRGADYSPALSPDQVTEYDADMERLFKLAPDPYEVALTAGETWGGQ